MEDARTARRRAFLINSAYVVLVAGGVLLLAWAAVRWLLPLVLAVPLAAALQRPRRWLEKRLSGGGKAAAAVLVFALLMMLLAAVLLVVWRLAVWLEQDPAGRLLKEIGTWRERIGSNLTAWSRALPPELSRTLEELAGRIPALLSEKLTALAGAAAGAVLQRLPSWLLNGLVFVMAAVTLTVEYETVWDAILRRLPDSRRKTVTAARDLCGEAARRMLRAYGLLLAVTFGELLIGFWVLKVDGALKWATLIAVVDILPVLGAGAALIPWALVCFLSGDGALGAGLLVLWGVISLVRRVMEPKVIGKEMGLPPLLMLAVMLVGLRVAGFWGLILFPVAAMLIRELSRHGYLFSF